MSPKRLLIAGAVVLFAVGPFVPYLGGIGVLMMLGAAAWGVQMRRAYRNQKPEM